MIKISSFEFQYPFFQAALAGYTDYPMRILARRFGCPLAFTGVMLDKIALHPKAIKMPRFRPSDGDHPIGAQILGDDPKTIAAAAAVFRQIGYDLIDLNFACPALKVLRCQRGGYLMQKPAFIRETYLRTKQAVSCPVWMKLRVGFDHSDAAQEDFWQIIENAAQDKADAIAVHGRTVKQKYRQKADWDIITRIKKKYPGLTVIGSGDLLDAQTAVGRLRQSGVDAVLIARGAIGNPWIFRELAALWQNLPAPAEPTLAEQGQVMLEHFEIICRDLPDSKAVPYFRKFAVGYVKRHQQRKKTLLDIMSAENAEQLVGVIEKCYGL